jgi:O-antigen/teichoic acid export membrane protein
LLTSLALRYTPGPTMRRLASGAMPAGIATGLLAGLPFLGRAFLPSPEYAVWALVSTIATVGLVFDFGAPALATRLAASKRLGRTHLATLLLLSSMASIVIGLLAALAWPWYVNLTSLPRLPDIPIMLIAVSVGSALRSCISVYCSVALGREQFAVRGVSLLGQAIAQCAVTALSLWMGFGIASLPIGQALSTIPVLTVIALRMKIGVMAWDATESASVWKEVRTFFRARGIASAIGLSFTQLDRWIVGVVATPAVLADYDLAARVASIPKIAVLTLGLSYLLESARATNNISELQRLIRKLLSYNAAILILAFGVCGIALWIAQPVLLKSTTQYFVPLLLALCIVSFANSMTAPGVMVLSGLGRPQFELHYLVPAFVASVAFVIPSIMAGSTVLVVGSILVPLFGGSLFFLARQRSYLVATLIKIRPSR